MKKGIVVVLFAIFTICFCGNALATAYVVKSGDTISQIAEKELGSWRRYENIAKLNNIQSPYLIFPKQILQMPEMTNKVIVLEDFKKVAPVSSCKITAGTAVKKVIAGKIIVLSKKNPKVYTDKNVGADPWRGSIVKGLHLLKIDIPKGEIRFADEGIEYLKSGEVFQMVSGKNKVDWYRSNLSKEKSKICKFGILVNGKKVTSVYQKPECGNWLRRILIEKPPIRRMPPGIALIVPPLTKNPTEEKVVSGDEWDWYIGTGIYHNATNGDDNHGRYYWTKLRVRPWWWKITDNPLGIQKIGLGGFGFLAGGKGVAAKFYDYKWQEAVLGGTAKIYAKHSDYDIDIGIGKLWNKGSWKGAEDRDQIDDIFLTSIHGNFYLDDKNTKWFPKYELNLEYRLPLRTEMKKGSKVNNEVLEGSYTQWIYKFKLGENDSFNLSPGINIGVGYEKSSSHEDFVKFGPTLEFASYGNVIGAISLFNYKVQGAGQWHPLGGYVSIDGIYSAWKASNITEVSADDLIYLKNGKSKLLKNPADYLK